MHNFFRKSLAHKTAVLAVGIGVAAGIGYAVLQVTQLPKVVVTPGELLLMLYVFFLLLLALFVVTVVLPLRRITRQMEAVMQGRQYAKVDHKGKIDEFGIIARFFNVITASIERVSMDITDRKRLTAELQHATIVQRQLLPKRAPKIFGLDVAVKTRSMSEVGGDNFDIVTGEKNTLLYIGDATGHGSPAGIIMSMVNVLIHAASAQTQDPVVLLALVNRCLTPKILPTMFMTLVMLRWEHEAQKLYYTGCGHEHVLHYHANTTVCEAHKTGGIALGMVPQVDRLLKEQELPLMTNDTVVLFTDGITEARNAKGEMYTVERLRQAVEKYGDRHTASAIFKGISEDFAEFVGPNYVQDDDITLMVLKYNLKGMAETHEGLQLSVDTSNIPEMDKPNWEW